MKSKNKDSISQNIKKYRLLNHMTQENLAEQLSQIEGVSLRYTGSFFHEFVTDQPDAAKVLDALQKEGILGGLPLEDGGILWCATEKNTKEDIDRVVEIVRKELM